jgi:hypothetical protein
MLLHQPVVFFIKQISDKLGKYRGLNKGKFHEIYYVNGVDTSMTQSELTSIEFLMCLG